MNLTPTQLVTYAVVALLYLALVWTVDQRLEGRNKTYFRWLAGIATPGFAFYFIGKIAQDLQIRVGAAKLFLALIAAGAVAYETQRAQSKQPVSERWKKFVGVTLGFASIVLYFNALDWGYPKYYHRWDQYHYYMGAKYFKELGYDGLYKCSVIAQDDLGVVDWYNPDTKRTIRTDFRAEARAHDKKIRNLGGDNLLIPVDDILAHPEECRDKFTPERWEAYKQDVKHFRMSCWDGKQYWEDMQRDHGYNPPPVWTLTGKLWAELHPASTGYLQFLGLLDVFYLLAMFAGIWWAFGWRVFAVAAVFWGTQASAPSFWTLGAFLRQDWLFWFVMAACFMRKKWFMWAGASLVYAGLLRIFPGLAIVGWLTVAGVHLVKHKNLAPHHWRVLAGGVLAAAILIPASMVVAGKDSYKEFYQHTLKVHDSTPLTNHMGLRVMIAHAPGTDWHSGRMKYTKDMKLTDPFETWKNMRLDRYRKYRWVGYLLMAATLGLLIGVHRRVKNLWVAQCLGQIWIILGSQLTCYYYSFMILMAPLTKLYRPLEAPIFLFAAITQAAHMLLYWNDDKYAVLTWVSALMLYGIILLFLPKSLWERFKRSEPSQGVA